MTNLMRRSARAAGLAVLLSVSSVASATAAAPATPKPGVEVTEADVAESNREIQEAWRALTAMWTDEFNSVGRRFVVPRIAYYRGNVRTACGVMTANNAAYCSSNNAIYFDEVFVARQRKEAARLLGTDGDMAGIGVIAHEMGHAVAIQLGVASAVPYTNEAIADCLAGAFARVADQRKELEAGDLEEAFVGLAAAGDPEVELTGNERIDARRMRRAQLMGHGTSEQRMANFKAGVARGTPACLPQLFRS